MLKPEFSNPDAKFVTEFHRRSDVDSSQFAQHHTLGNRRNQAAPGDHTHDGITSPRIGAGAFFNSDWISYTPSLYTSSSVLIAGWSKVGRYLRVGDTVFFKGRIRVNTSSDFGDGTDWLINLPVAYASESAIGNNFGMPIGQALCRDIGATADYFMTCFLVSGSKFKVAGPGPNNFMDGSVPFLWGSNDYIVFSGRYDLLVF